MGLVPYWLYGQLYGFYRQVISLAASFFAPTYNYGIRVRLAVVAYGVGGLNEPNHESVTQHSCDRRGHWSYWGWYGLLQGKGLVPH